MSHEGWQSAGAEGRSSENEWVKGMQEEQKAAAEADLAGMQEMYQKEVERTASITDPKEQSTIRAILRRLQDRIEGKKKELGGDEGTPTIN